MSRKDPISPPPLKKEDRAGWGRQVRKYRLITPLYGGGEETQKPDSITVVRATEVRGQLRFWWRATRGGAFGGDLKRMREMEETIWGSSGEKGKPGPSELTLVIKEFENGSVDRPFEVTENARGRPQVRPRRDSNVHPYAAFPLQPDQKEARPGIETKSVRTGVAFTLELFYPEGHQDELKAALWAWETFGGIGARTRRGFGALQCVEMDGHVISPHLSQSLDNAFNQELQNHVVQNGDWPAGVPHLSTDIRKYKLIRRAGSPIDAWYDLIESLKKFRQWRRTGTDHNRPGRSYWPEPEEIRTRTGQRYPDHQPLPSVTESFPRAKFGLPIIFHFKDTNRRDPHDADADPRDTTLQGANHDRLASPLILRPIACSDGAVGLAAILEWEPLETKETFTPPGGLILKGAQKDSIVESELDEEEANAIRPLGGNTDVLDAFLRSLQ